MGDRQRTTETATPHAIFRFPRIGIVAAVLAMMFGSPFALSYPPFAAVYLVPLAAIYWIVRMRTVSDSAGLTTRTLVGSEHLPWTELRGLSITTRSKVRAVRQDGTEVPLPAVTPRHLPIISAVSNGRLPDPTAGSGARDRSPTDRDSVPTADENASTDVGSDAAPAADSTSNAGDHPEDTGGPAADDLRGSSAS